jgi:hypothetical protein
MQPIVTATIVLIPSFINIVFPAEIFLSCVIYLFILDVCTKFVV